MMNVSPASEDDLPAAVEFARSAGCRRVTLLTDADNAAAQRFYGRHPKWPMRSKQLWRA
jgi:ribosomal protein S18 acetylase RimI-like enzyme